ncbi:outer membrane beta-barrel protein [Roseinatronobacter alkalisoli]|uniref:Outer membrane beta-barrel protein n=1 Tax=Roseinatronobacter alkalisoli TaxID=3028235 RepID=A0ABT5TA18_9RHOB|nr:outer membrane beta-barrel protein [Roseinatronobacter sp. HJB301]MDD7971955.1 outer membrane beta-barrel protein [Roseinatronobacter sp. HJB301]
MKKLIAIALIAGFAAPAFAGNVKQPTVEPQVMTPAPAPAPTYVNWTGAYAGATLGFGRATWTGGNSKTAAGGALHGGYNMDMGTWVTGVELSVAPGFDQTIGGREINWAAAVRGRAGPKFGDEGRFWGFGTLGVAHVNHDAVGGGDTRSTNGLVAGVGVSHLMQSNMILTGEVLHSRSRGGANVNATGLALGASLRF